tara:strand:+ start:286 stop:456 length:171 start_codon:yes stop_codon:yes gene_type:complete
VVLVDFVDLVLRVAIVREQVPVVVAVGPMCEPEDSVEEEQVEPFAEDFHKSLVFAI